MAGSHLLLQPNARYRASMRSRDHRRAYLALFFGSGATALIYEVVWSKFLSLMFGSTVYAQTVVLAVFMGGLALGNRMFGNWADRWSHPVRAYGFLEMAIGVYAFLFPALYRMADQLFVLAGAGMVEQTGYLLAFKGALSGALLLGPTVMMGGTLPLMAAWLQKFDEDAGRVSARFYSVNSLGAVTGAGVAGFWLVPRLGLESSLQMTAFVNLLIGGLAVLLDRSSPRESAPTIDAASLPQSPDSSFGVVRRAGFIVALTGGVSMGLEVLASRSLALIFGSSLQAFAIVLIAFILGIGLGSAWIASPRRRITSSEKLMVLLLCGAAAWVVLLVFNIERWADVFRLARTGLARSSVGYLYNQWLAGGMALVILGLPAAAIGAVLPLMIRVHAREGATLGREVGALLTWNTLGAVAGVLLTGFVLMPQLGLRNAFGVLALLLGLVAVTVALSRRWAGGIAVAVGVSLLTTMLFAFGNEQWRHVMNAGVFRVRETVFDPNVMAKRKQHVKLLFYEDAPDATVTVEESDGIQWQAQRSLRINGKTDATSGSDLSTQLLLAHVPMLAKPGARDVFVLGLGSGVTAGALLLYPLERIDVAENCAPVIRAARYFEDWNRRVVDNPRARIWREDARTVLKLRSQLYDVIITEPSNPWTAGVGSVFSQEFYELAASRLKPGGLVAQWFHVYEMHDGIVTLVLRTFASVFPFMEVWDTGAGDILLVGSRQPWRSEPEVFRGGYAMAEVASDLAAVGIRSPEALLARQLASQRTGFAIASPGPLESDLFPLLEHVAPEAFFIGDRARLLSPYDERTWQQQLAPAGKQATLRALPADVVRSVFSAFQSVNDELLFHVLAAGSATNTPCLLPTGREPSPPPASQLDPAIVALNSGDFEGAAAIIARALEQDVTDAQAAYLGRILERERQWRRATSGAR